MPTLNELANTAKREIMAGDTDHVSRDKHYLLAGAALAAAKKRVGHGKWLNWLRNNVQVGERRAREFMEMFKGAKTPEQVRHRKADGERRRRAKSAPCGADLAEPATPATAPSAPRSRSRASDCDYDWSNVRAADFGSPARAYKAQASHYRREATDIAEAYPLRSSKIDPRLITEEEIQAVREVVRVWQELVDVLMRRKHQEAV